MLGPADRAPTADLGATPALATTIEDDRYMESFV